MGADAIIFEGAMERFSIMFLCTGNRFRSPLAAAFVHRLTIALPVDVTSRGILELHGSPPLREALEIARWSGLDLSGHTALQLDSDAAQAADLILGFEQLHVRHAVVDFGAARDRTFTLPDFVNVAEPTTDHNSNDLVLRARSVVESAARRRRDTQLPTSRDVPDPFGRSWTMQYAVAHDVRELSIRLVATLFGIDQPKGLPALPVDAPSRRRRSLWRRSSS